MDRPIDRPLRVLIGVPFGTRQGGAERLLDDFLERAADVAVEPHVVFLLDGPWPERLTAAGIPTTVIVPGRFRDVRGNVRAIAELRRLMQQVRPDVVLSWVSRAHVLMAPAAVAAGLRKRLVWFQHQVQVLAVERAATLLPAEVVLACSKAAADAQRGLWPHRRVQVVHPGIVMPELLEPAAKSRLRADLGIPSSATVIGISGRLVRWKHQDTLIRAIAILRDRELDVHGLVVGSEGHGLDPGFGDELRALCRSLRIESHVTFTGFREDAVAVTQVMDIAVNASDPEPFGLTILEALAVRVPVVAVASGGPAEIIESGRTGVLISESSAEQLADALQGLIDDPGRCHAIGEAGQGAVLRDFTVDRFVRDLRTSLERVAQGDRQASC